jgi:hypothetical protein
MMTTNSLQEKAVKKCIDGLEEAGELNGGISPTTVPASTSLLSKRPR